MDPVRIVIGPEGMTFKQLEIEKNFQLAELSYDYKGENVKYFPTPNLQGFLILF